MDIISKVKSLKKQHDLKRSQLELSLETTPRDSRYSDQLVEMMRREEYLLANGGSSENALNDLNIKLNKALFDETNKYFSNIASQNAKKWSALQTKLSRECDKLKQEISERAVRSRHNANSNFSNETASKIVDLDEEAARLEMEYNKNWLTYESFHLREAFKSQANKIERDWSLHEKSLRDDYDEKRGRITGSSEKTNGKSTKEDPDTNSNAISRWQNNEKQRTLVHTCPVLSPSSRKTLGTITNQPTSRSNGHVLSKRDEAEIIRLERQFAEAMEQHNRQKNSAIRWMNRQKIRLMAQAEAMQIERTAISQLLTEQQATFSAILSLASQSSNVNPTLNSKSSSITYPDSTAPRSTLISRAKDEATGLFPKPTSSNDRPSSRGSRRSKS